MSRRFLMLDLDPDAPTVGAALRLVVLPLGPERAAIALDDLTQEQALAELLASGVAIRRSRLVNA